MIIIFCKGCNAVPFRREKLVYSYCSLWVDPPLHTAHAYSSLGWTAPIMVFFRTAGENLHLDVGSCELAGRMMCRPCDLLDREQINSSSRVRSLVPESEAVED